MFKRKKLIREKSREAIQLGGQEVTYTLVRSSRAKRLSLKIGEQTGLEVVVPLRASLSHIPRFIRGKEQWVLQHLQEIEANKASKPQLRDGARVTILGVTQTIRLFPTRKPKPHVKEARALKYDQDTAYYDRPEILIYANSLTDAREALEKHLRKQAKQHFRERTAELAEEMDVTFNRVTIKGQKSRWGSCSRDKNLNFNWRLVFTSLEVSDSIIYHELAHTVHLNHGKRFYALLEKHCPDHKKLSLQLKNSLFLL